VVLAAIGTPHAEQANSNMITGPPGYFFFGFLAADFFRTFGSASSSVRRSGGVL
jgi:hypothetical protein